MFLVIVELTFSEVRSLPLKAGGETFDRSHTQGKVQTKEENYLEKLVDCV